MSSQAASAFAEEHLLPALQELLPPQPDDPSVVSALSRGFVELDEVSRRRRPPLQAGGDESGAPAR